MASITHDLVCQLGQVKVIVWVYITLVLCGVGQGQGNNFKFPADEYEYSLRRDSLKEAEDNFQGKNYVLSENEEIVDHYLNYLKVEEYENTKDTGFPPSRPIEDMLDHIVNSNVYNALLKLPKGGNLHTHENHQLSKRTLLEIVWASDDFKYLYIQTPNSSDPWAIDFFVNPPADDARTVWLNVQNDTSYTVDDVYPHHQLIGILDEDAKRHPTDTKKRWALMDTLWMKGSSHIIANLPIKIRYLEEMYKHSINEGVTYIESRKNLGSSLELIYVMDTDPEYASTHGKRYLDKEGEKDIEVTLSVIANISAEYPEFIGHKRISYTQRQQPFETLEADMNRTLQHHLAQPSHVIGYDIVGHEDAGNSHLYYVTEFLKQHENGGSKLKFFFHTAETKWADDLMTSDHEKDPVGTNENVYEAVLLGALRVGHGTGFMRHPHLLHLIEERGTAIEVCPVSGHILGYFPDLRNHPAVAHFRSGDSVVLGSDDAGSFGFEHFNVDWYEVFMAWGLDLRDLRQLALNSLQMSAMSEEEKADAVNNKWKSSWDKYIEDTKEIACAENFTAKTPTFARILPRAGAITGSTKVHVFGRNFQRGICKDVKCYFGGVPSPNTKYITCQHIICESPERSAILRANHAEDSLVYLSGGKVTVNVTVSFENGHQFDTGENFTYMHEEISSTTESTTLWVEDNASMVYMNQALLLLALMLSLLMVTKC